jgi:hypothetical protein
MAEAISQVRRSSLSARVSTPILPLVERFFSALISLASNRCRPAGTAENADFAVGHSSQFVRGRGKGGLCQR